jgi:hypothetical protein
MLHKFSGGYCLLQDKALKLRGLRNHVTLVSLLDIPMEVPAFYVEEAAQIRRITEHHLFRGSESLCGLLRFLFEHTVNHRSEPLREFDIATQVFKRRPDFDPQSDSIVRVQIGRLRARLAQFYAEAGLSDPVIVEIPRGGYSLSISYRERPHAPEPVAISEANSPTSVVIRPARRREIRNLVIAVMTTAAVTLGLVAGVNSLRKPQIAGSLEVFWNPFISVPDAPLVIYSNQIRPAAPPAGVSAVSSSPPVHQNPFFTGTGEVMGAVDLTRLFVNIGHDIHFRGEALTPWEDVKDSNLIFVGTATQSAKALGGPERFVLRRQIPGDSTSPMVIADLSPEPGHPAVYHHSAECCQPIDEDYGLIIFSRGLTPERVALSMFGTTTMGTQAAVEFSCDADSLSSLLDRLPKNHSKHVPFFETLLHVTVRGGAPIASEIVAVHVRKQQ